MLILGTHDAKTIEQLRGVDAKAVRTALMADGHLGYIMPVGGVAAYREQVSVSGVGYDIACGNCAIRTDLLAESLSEKDRQRLADAIAATISFGVGRKNSSADAPDDHALFSDPRWDVLPSNVREPLRQKARQQLGTVGSGNHYVDVFADEQGRIWVGVHFGSRGFGHTVATGFLALSAGERWGTKIREHDAILDLRSLVGADYWALMELAGEYAHAGREWVTRKVVGVLGGTEVEMVHNHHNFAWREKHFGEELIVVRKGATPAFPDQRGFVGGSMGDDAVILRGTPGESDRQRDSLYSTVHGAGRVMSRTQAAGKERRSKGWVCGQRACGATMPLQAAGRGGANPRCPKCGSRMNWREIRERVAEGLVKPHEMAAWIESRGVTLRGGGLDEAPQAYRRLPEVLAAQGDTVEILHTLRPLIVVMAGADELDPYRD
jgi:tRNA-splicing ligase RtcB (3'-phosphate/5'-hydroxy nucleic acid ligase)